jgi:hypothetical protein
MIPSFREIIYKFRKPASSNSEYDKKCKIPVALVSELQLLFAHMQLSLNKFNSPEDLLKNVTDDDGIKIEIGAQKDAGEFNINLITKFDQGVSYEQREPSSYNHSYLQTQSTTKSCLYISPSELTTNKVLKMFFGLFDIQIQASTLTEKTGEVFGQLVLSPSQSIFISWIKNYYKQKIENYLNAKGEGEAATQTYWITTLPRVMFIQIQRVKYNKETKTAEKNQKRFIIEKMIYMDQLMNQNSSFSADIFNRVIESRKELKKINAILSKWSKYTNSNDKMLENTIHFINAQSVTSAHASNSKLSYPEDLTSESNAINKLDIVKEYFKLIEQKSTETINRIKARKEKFQNEIKNVLYQKGNFPYYLHSIIIHSGTPDSGHYYVYIQDFANNKWWKCSDHVVTEADEKTVMREASGGENDLTSAYFLVYINEEEYRLRKKDVLAGLDGKVKPIYHESIPHYIKDTILKTNQNQKYWLENYKCKAIVNKIGENYKTKKTAMDRMLKDPRFSYTKGIINFMCYLNNKKHGILAKWILLDNVFSDEYNGMSIEQLPYSESICTKLEELLRSEADIYPPNLKPDQPAQLKLYKDDYIKVVSSCYALSYALNLIINDKIDDGTQAMIYVMNKQMPKSETEFVAVINKIMLALIRRLADNIKCIIRGGDSTSNDELQKNCRTILYIYSAFKPDSDSELQMAVNEFIGILNINKGFESVRNEVMAIKSKLQLHQYEVSIPFPTELCKVCDNVANG